MDLVTGVVVPSCDDTDLLSRLIDSLYTVNPGAPFSLTIVDDKSKQERHQKYLQYMTQFASVITAGQKLYFTRAVNAGLQHHIELGRKFMFLLNSDTAVTDNWLAPLVELATLKDIGIIGSTLLNPDGITTQHLGGYGAGYHFQIDKPWLTRHDTHLVPWVTGAAMFIRRDVVNRIGYLPQPSSPSQYDFSDRNYCMEARRQGYEVAVCHRSIIYHYTHQARQARQVSA